MLSRTGQAPKSRSGSRFRLPCQILARLQEVLVALSARVGDRDIVLDSFLKSRRSNSAMFVQAPRLLRRFPAYTELCRGLPRAALQTWPTLEHGAKICWIQLRSHRQSMPREPE